MWNTSGNYSAHVPKQIKHRSLDRQKCNEQTDGQQGLAEQSAEINRHTDRNEEQPQ
jgi:hypothetical protein